MAGPRVRVGVNAIVHATEREDAIAGALEMLGASREAQRRTIVEGHFGNPIVRISAAMSGRDATHTVHILGSALGWQSGAKARSEIGEHVFDAALHIRLDKQELVMGRIVHDASGAVRVRISVPAYGTQSAQDAYADLFTAKAQ